MGNLLQLSLLILWLTSQQYYPTSFAVAMETDQLDIDCVPDITDMMDYDPVSQTSARCVKLKKEKQKLKYQCEANLRDTQRQLDDCLRSGSQHAPCDCPPPGDCSQQVVAKVTCPDVPKADDMFFRRITRHLVNVLQQKAPETGKVEANMGVHLTSREWKKLQNFVEGKEDYRKADIHDILVGMTIDVFHINQTSTLEWLRDQINLTSPGIILMMLSLTVIALVFGVGMFSDIYWNRRFQGCLLTTILVISLLWNWIYLYQEESIKRYRNAQQYDDIPANCMPHKMSWIQTLQEWFRSMSSVQTDACFEYHRLFLVDPLFDIPPTRALSFTLSVMVVDPMKYIGRAVSEFHAEIFRDLPLWAALPALFSCYVFGFIFVYAYIAAPRRRFVGEPNYIRNAPRPVQQPAIREQPPLQLQDPYNKAILNAEPGYREEERVENVRPPTLPAADHRDPLGANVGAKDPQGARDPLGPRDHQGARGPPEAKGTKPASSDATEKPRHPSEGNGIPDDQPELPTNLERVRKHDPAVRPKTHRSPTRKIPKPVDENETDISSLSSVEPTSRPTTLHREEGSAQPKGSPRKPVRRSVGGADSGVLISHPASESSMTSSVFDQRQSDVETLSVASQGLEPEASVYIPDNPQRSQSPSEETTTDCLTSSSLSSPDDISVISQSPENTNSATYEFISTSRYGMNYDGQAEAAAATKEQEGHAEEESDDDFVVLKKESHSH